jgi:hypothetical protein
LKRVPLRDYYDDYQWNVNVNLTRTDTGAGLVIQLKISAEPDDMCILVPDTEMSGDFMLPYGQIEYSATFTEGDIEVFLDILEENGDIRDNDPDDSNVQMSRWYREYLDRQNQPSATDSDITTAAADAA